jgi:hypothetical protein
MKPTRAGRADIAVENHGSLVLLDPLSQRAAQWLHDVVSEGAQWWGRALVVEPRYVVDIVRGAVENGLRVR